MHYATKLLSSQLKAGESYQKINPIIQINLVDFPIFKEEGIVKVFQLRENKLTDLILTKDFKLVYVELGRFHKMNVDELSNTQEIWFWLFNNMHKATQDDMLKVLKQQPDVKNAYGVLERYSSDPEMRRQVEERLRTNQNYVDQLAARYQLGLEEGIEKGIRDKALESAKKMLELGIEINQILEITGLNESDLQN